MKKNKLPYSINWKKLANGRPLKYSLKDFTSAFDEYVEECHEPVLNEDGEIIKYNQIKPMILVGYLNRMTLSREVWSDYLKKDGFSDTLSCIKKTIEESLVNKALTDPKNFNGCKFVLTNGYGYSDKQIIESTNTNVNKTLNIEIVDKDQNE